MNSEFGRKFGLGDLISVSKETVFSSGSVCFSSEKGTQHPENEDNLVVTSIEETLVLAVIDGMGGEGYGKVASSFLKLAIEEAAENANLDFLKIHKRASQLIRESVGHSPGAAYVAAIIEGNRLTVNMAGDSRALVVDKDGNIKRQTEDESILYLLSNCVCGGDPGRVVVPIKDFLLEEGDVVTLLTDGITDNSVTREPFLDFAREYKRLVGRGTAENIDRFLSERTERENSSIAEVVKRFGNDLKKMTLELMKLAEVGMLGERGKSDDHTVIVYRHGAV